VCLSHRHQHTGTSGPPAAPPQVNKLCKHKLPDISTAATAVVSAWKDCVRSEAKAQQAAGQGSDSQGGTARADSLGAPAPSSLELPESQPEPAAAPAAAGPSSYGSSLLEASRTASAGSGRLPPVSSGNPKRDKVRQLIGDALALAAQESGATDVSPAEVAADIETEIYSACGDPTRPEYTAKVSTAVDPPWRRRLVTVPGRAWCGRQGELRASSPLHVCALPPPLLLLPCRRAR